MKGKGGIRDGTDRGVMGKEKIGATLYPRLHNQNIRTRPFPSLAPCFSIILRRVPRKEFLDATDRVPGMKKSVHYTLSICLWGMLSANV